MCTANVTLVDIDSQSETVIPFGNLFVRGRNISFAAEMNRNYSIFVTAVNIAGTATSSGGISMFIG